MTSNLQLDLPQSASPLPRRSFRLKVAIVGLPILMAAGYGQVAKAGQAGGAQTVSPRRDTPSQVVAAVPRLLHVVPGPESGRWRLNGQARFLGSEVVLTDQAKKSIAGSAFWPTPILSARYLRAAFDVAIGDGTGADGVALALADTEAGANPAALGKDANGHGWYFGGELGWAGIPGIAVALDTYKNASDPSSNFVGVATGSSRKSADSLAWAASTTNLPRLRNAVHHVVVLVSVDGALTVWMDGREVLATRVTLPHQMLVGFTAANGGLTDRHAVSNVMITTG
jgi:hypothetical protein